MTDRLLAAIDRLVRWSAYLAAALLAGLFALSFAEVVSRALFDASLGLALEFGSYLVAHVLLLGSGWALTDRGHIRVSLLLERLTGRARATLELAASLAGLLIAAVLAAALVGYTVETALLGTRSYFPTATPLWIPQALLAVGPAVLALAFLARLIRLLRGEEPGG